MYGRSKGVPFLAANARVSTKPGLIFSSTTLSSQTEERAIVMLLNMACAASSLLVAQARNLAAFSLFFDCLAIDMPHEDTMNGALVFGPAGRLAIPTFSAGTWVLAGSTV